jgi:hypothetical protein
VPYVLKAYNVPHERTEPGDLLRRLRRCLSRSQNAARCCCRFRQRPAGSPLRSATLGTETSSVLTDGRTERRTVCATRWERAARLHYGGTQHGADARGSSSGRRQWKIGGMEEECVEVEAMSRLNLLTTPTGRGGIMFCSPACFSASGAANVNRHFPYPVSALLSRGLDAGIAAPRTCGEFRRSQGW